MSFKNQYKLFEPEETSKKGGGYLKEAEQKKRLAEQIWLEYLNQILFERGIISEAERNKLLLRIGNKKLPAAAK